MPRRGPVPTPQTRRTLCHIGWWTEVYQTRLITANQQLILDTDSRQYVTINTHKGLYQYTRLPFGISSAPAIFQKTMDTILQGLPNVLCYLDDILITGADDDTYLCNLSAVLERLQHHGVHMKKAKCRFMQDEVVYLGHKIDSEGLSTTTEKVEAVVNAPEPHNVQQHRSFL